MKYEINKNTIAIIYENNGSVIFEKNNKIILNNITPNEIIKYNCEFYGSSLLGRINGTKFLTGYTHKCPIIIEESREIIFFPIKSHKLYDCSWINNKYIIRYEIKNKNIELITPYFKEIIIKCSKETIENQILRSSRLESVLRHRKEQNFV